MNRTNFQSKIIAQMVLLLVFTSFSNAQDITGSLSGQVSDTPGAGAAGVNISVESDNLQGVRGTATDKNGFFRIFNLPPGHLQNQSKQCGIPRSHN